MKRRLGVVGLLMVFAVLGAVAIAGAPGFSRVYALPSSGDLSITNTEANAIWRPCVVSVICTNAVVRTVTIYRLNSGMEYAVGRTTAVSLSYVYQFTANYYTAVSNGIKVTVRPACTGLVEVICE